MPEFRLELAHEKEEKRKRIIEMKERNIRYLNFV